ncbi:hypothetical protein D3C78_1751470 [compost metagenome]
MQYGNRTGVDEAPHAGLISLLKQMTRALDISCVKSVPVSTALVGIAEIGGGMEDGPDAGERRGVTRRVE